MKKGESQVVGKCLSKK